MSHFSPQDVLLFRHQALRFVRDFFSSQNFIEVQTPLLVSNPGLEPNLKYFETRYEPDFGALPVQTFYLPTSPEYHLKKTLAWGLPKIFEITKSFRNGEYGKRHQPEFLMLEWYRHPGTYQEIANDTFALFSSLAKHCQELGYQVCENFSKRKDITVTQAFMKYADINLEAALRVETQPHHADSLVSQCLNLKHQSIRKEDSFADAFNKIIVEKIEPQLGKESVCFLWDYPASQAALSRRKKDNPLFAERFEVYVKGVELANAFGELCDPVEQRMRCLADQAERLRLYGKTPELDEEFLGALSKLSHAGGIAVGLERVFQVLLGLKSISEINPFAH